MIKIKTQLVKLIMISSFLITNTTSFYGQCWQKVETGLHQTIAIKSDGTLWSWGKSALGFGQIPGNCGNLGLGVSISNQCYPKQVGTDTDWLEISSSSYYCLAIKNNGTLWAWGSSFGGRGNTGIITPYGIDLYVPTQVGTDSNWTSISAGHQFAMAIKNNGSIWGWASDATLASPIIGITQKTPMQIGNDYYWKNVSCGDYHSIALKTNNSLWAIGNNYFGELGTGVSGTGTNQTTFVQIGNDFNWEKISTGDSFSLALKNDGTLWSWGKNNKYQLGDNSILNKNIPTRIGTDTNWIKITAANNSGFGIKLNGTLWGWGNNTAYELGDGTSISKRIPTQNGIDVNWKFVSSKFGTLVLKNDGTLYGGGSNFQGALGLTNGTFSGAGSHPPFVANFTQIKCSTPFVAVNDSGTSIYGSNSIVIPDIRLNDLTYGNQANSINTKLTITSSPQSGINVNTTTGAVSVNSTVPIGTYTITYNLSDINEYYTSICGVSATITISVTSALIANPDFATTTVGIFNTSIVNVLSNDSYNGLPVTALNNTLTFVNSTNSGISLNLTNGDVSVSNSVPIGTYTLTYQICSNGSVSNCTNGIVTINVACGLSPTLDLMTKDGPTDLGAQPNTVTQYFWDSTDIWVRNNPDNGLEHQNPEYSPTQPNFAYVRVVNKSCVPSTGNETMTFYWAKASTSLAWPTNWNGQNYFPSPNNTKLLGARVGILTIPVLQPGKESILEFPFMPPNPADYNFFTDLWHFCLLSRIEAANNSPIEGNDLVTNVLNNNNVAWKNVSVVDLIENVTYATVSVGNPSDEVKTYSMELVQEPTEPGKPIYDEAEITVKMDETLFNAWQRGGKIAQNLESTTDEKRKIVQGNNVLLDKITFNPKEIGMLNINFNFLTKELTLKSKFVYRVIQRDVATGKIIGGETYVIKKQSRPAFLADAGGDKIVDKNLPVTISAVQISEPATYNWYDHNGNLIFTGKDLQIANAVAEKYKLEVISTVDGFKDYSEMELKINPNRLKNVAPNPVNNSTIVSYNLNEVSSAYLMIVSYYMNGGVSNNYVLDVNTTQTSINFDNYANGFYKVVLVTDGQITGTKIIVKQ